MGSGIEGKAEELKCEATNHMGSKRRRHRWKENTAAFKFEAYHGVMGGHVGKKSQININLIDRLTWV
jgi:hypothetical protein